MSSSFPGVRIEGGLLGPELLDQLVAGDLPGQKPADFGLEPRRNLTDEIAAVFADSRALWGVFQNRLARLPEDDIATTVTRDQWALPFLTLLGYQARYNTRAFEVDGQTFAVSHRAGEPDDAPPIHGVGTRQELGRVPPSGRPRLAPHSLVQEYLNRTEHVWGMVTNGLTLRLLRDSTLVRRQAYVEFDLQGILEEQRFHDFAALYRLLHRTRLPRGLADSDACLLEKYHAQTIEQGGRVRDKLRDGVEECLKLLGNAFLVHPANDELRQRLRSGLLSAAQFYRQLFRLIYRFLFLLVSEDRGLISPSPLYRDHYGIGRLRRLLDVHAAWTGHPDLWLGLRTLFHLFQDDKLSAVLTLAPLNGELFAAQTLDACTLSNRDLLAAFWYLAYYQDKPGAPSRRVNYAALDVEELGSVYESLLEFHPDITDHESRLTFDLVFGSERKTTGSFYTPPELVNELIESALLPVVRERLASVRSPGFSPSEVRSPGFSPSEVRSPGFSPSAGPAKAGNTNQAGPAKAGTTNSTAAERALLSLKIIDPACGSGHMLLAAARRVGQELATVRTGEDEPAPERVRESIRDVISHCIYGVDKNPLAVDLCRVALWLESHTAGKPLTFLDHRIRCGDSLVGVFDLATLAEPIPDAAFRPLAGDDKAVAREVTARNREEGSGSVQQQLGLSAAAVLSRANARSHEVDAIPDDTPTDIQRKKKAYDDARHHPDWVREWKAAHLWTAAFYAPLTPDAVDRHQIPTTAAVREVLAGRPAHPQTIGWVETAAYRNQFFHWPLEFPEVFARSAGISTSDEPAEAGTTNEPGPAKAGTTSASAGGGFDVVLSNPPWERVKLQEQEFFASRDPTIALARNKAARGELIRKLRETNPGLHREFIEASHSADATSLFLRESDRYPLAGRGDINTYAVFAELISRILAPRGRAGFVVPLGLATDDTTKALFGDFIKNARLVALTGYENEDFIFPAVDHRVTFSTVVLAGPESGSAEARIGFFIRRFAQLRETHRFFRLSPRDFALLNPNTGNCPIFRTQADAELTKAIYRRVPVLLREGTADGNPWNLGFGTLFHMANDSHHFRTRDQLASEGYRLEGNVLFGPKDRYLPLYEAKMLHQFDHRFSTYEGATQAQLNVGTLPRPTLEQKRDPAYAVLPDYWIREEVVESALPHYPEPLHVAVQLGDVDSVCSVLLLWLAGYHSGTGDNAAAQQAPFRRDRCDVAREVEKALKEYAGDAGARRLQGLFPLTDEDAAVIRDQLEDPLPLGRELVERFSPRWLMGSRDITNQGNERTLIATAIQPVAVGHTFPLAFSPWSARPVRLCRLANLNSFVLDYVARQKVGGTHITYGFLKQFAGLAPASYAASFLDGTLLDFVAPRVLELVYTAHDLAPLAHDCGYDGPPVVWEEARRLQIRAELDAAYLHAYLGPSDAWQAAPAETAAELTCLRAHFPTPRHAAGHILDSFPIVREKDEKAHGSYRTRDTILGLYDALTLAH